jgi:lysozyme
LPPGDDPLNPDTPDARLDAFLYMLRASECGQGAADDGAAYRMFYGGLFFDDLSDHPVLTGEKLPVPLPPQMCRDAGINPPCTSSAAGAYQIRVKTWRDVRQAGAWGPALPDFSSESQDEAARRLLIRSGALAYVMSGDFARAVQLAAPTWASLPGSTANQRPHTFDTVLAWYESALPSAAG